jgi:septal ring factor EnvC (AmiA/AmiB activator)
MAESLITTLERLDARIKDVTMRNARLVEQNHKLEEEIADLRLEIAEARRERDRARLDAEYLTVSHRLADSPDTLIDTRRHIAKLIRNIDRCLEMLKE